MAVDMENARLFPEATDARDGLSPSLRQIFSILQATLPESKFRRSLKAVQAVADVTGIDDELIFAALVDTTWPRCKFPLVDGLGNFGFPPAHPNFSELRLSSFFKGITMEEQICNYHLPLTMPIPYALVGGTLGYDQSSTKIPTHNLGEVIDATIALIQNPEIETKDLLQFMKGPDLLVGGTIENPEALCDIYESGFGIIKVVVTPQTINDIYLDDAKDYSNWYGMKARKIRGKDAIRIEIPYHAFMYDGTDTRLMSLKEILLSYINHCRVCKAGMTDEALCALLADFKKFASPRITQATL